jgi:hypothetical protein
MRLKSPKKVDLRKLERRVRAMEDDRATFFPVWRDLTDHFMVHRGRYDLWDANDGKRKDLTLYNNSPLLARRVLSAGMMSGITSPARPWFRLSSGDDSLDNLHAVKEWLHECGKILYRVFSMSNLYNSLQTYYNEVCTFGTASMGVFADTESFLRFETQTAGQYSIALGRHATVDVHATRRMRRVEELVQEFGEEGVPRHVLNLWKNGGENKLVEVYFLVEPNIERDGLSPFAWDKRFRAIMWVAGTGADEKPLLSTGYDEFPYMVTRWDVAPGDIYGTSSPAMVALGDAKALQLSEQDVLVAVERIAEPALLADTRLRRVLGDQTPAPGTVTYTDSMDAAVKELLSNYRPDLGAMVSVSGRYEMRIDDAFYVDLFLMLAGTDRRQMTAREVVEKHEEKLLQIGPVLERMHNELLDPLISRSFSILQRMGILPDPPNDLVGRELRVEYVSIMAQAQKLASLQTIERVAQFAASMVGLDPASAHKIDVDRMIDEYAETVGVDPGIIRSAQDMAAFREAMQQQQQAQQMGDSMQQGAQTARDASQASLAGENALSQIMRRAGLA